MSDLLANPRRRVSGLLAGTSVHGTFVLLFVLLLLRPVAALAQADDASWSTPTPTPTPTAKALTPLRQRGPLPPFRTPKTIVLLTSNLYWDEIRPNNDLVSLRRMASEGGAALMSTAVLGQTTEAAAYATLGAGARLTAPQQDGPRIAIDDVPMTVADIAGEVYPTNIFEGGAVRPVYVRRFGTELPVNAAGVNLGVPTLQRAQPSIEQADMIGALGDRLLRAGRKVTVYGDWRSALVGMDRRGIVYNGSVISSLTPSKLAAAVEDANVVIDAVGAGKGPLRQMVVASMPLKRRGADVLVVCASPPIDPKRDHWEHLGFVVAAGPDFPDHSTLTSATTRTPGLVSSVDIAPTILALQQVEPDIAAEGHTMETRPDRDVFHSLPDRDVRFVLGQEALLPIAGGYVALLIAVCIACMLLAHTPVGQRTSPISACALVLRVAAAGPLAFLLIGRLPFGHIWQMTLVFLAVSVMLSLAADMAASLRNASAIGLLLLATAILIAADALTGGFLGSYALPSEYWITGLRYYGTGNEYALLGIGCGLAGCALVAPRAMPLAGLALTAALGLPWFGANVGAAIVAALAFVQASLSIREERIQTTHLVTALAAALVAFLVIAALDNLLPAAVRTHAGDALGDPAALWTVLERKIQRSIDVTLLPATLGVIVGLVPLASIGLGSVVRDRLSRMFDYRRDLRLALPAAAAAAVCAALVTDSGLPAALFVLAPVAVAVIHEVVNG